jgi:lipid-binding SYLF domain-containing protein
MNKIPFKLACAAAVLAAAFCITQGASAGGREEGRLLTAAQVLEDIQGMPDQRVPDYLLQRAYGIAVIPDVDKVAFMFGGRRGKGALVVRDNLGAAWSNPVLVTLTGGSFGFQAGAQSSDILLVFTTKAGVEGIAGGKLTLGADASVATGPVGRQGSAATDIAFTAEIYSYARTRGLFGGIAIDGSVITIDRSANASLYGRNDVTATEIFSAASPSAPPAAQRFLEQVGRATRLSAQAAPAPAPPATAPPAGPAPGAVEPARTFPLETQPMTAEPEPKQP